VLAERLEWGAAYTDTGLVFVHEDGVGYHPRQLTDLFQGVARAAGVPVIRLHDALHPCATLALAAGIHPKVVQQLLGHASWSTTMDLYTRRAERLLVAMRLIVMHYVCHGYPLRPACSPQASPPAHGEG
jgi:site-specific recombinase XerD